MHTLAIFFLLMPYIGYGGLPSDVQPFAMAFALLAMAFLVVQRKPMVCSWALSGTFCVLLCALVSLIATLAIDEVSVDNKFIVLARALYGYLTPVVVFCYVSLVISSRLPANWVAICDFIIGITLLGFLMNIIGLTEIIQIFVSRAGFEGGLGGNRGLTSFYPEQSRVSVQAVYLAIIYLWQGRLNALRISLLLLCGLLSFAGQFFINIIVLIIAICMVSIVRTLKSGTLKLWILGAQVFGVVVASTILYIATNHAEYLISLGLPSRGINAIANISESGINYIGSDHGLLFKISGLIQGIAILIIDPFRFQISTSAYFIYDENLFNLYREILISWISAEYYPTPIKSFSVFGSYVSDFGVLGLCVIGLIIYKPISILLRDDDERIYSFISFSLVMMFYLLLVRSNTSDPTFWVCWAILIYGTKASCRSRGAQIV